LQEIASLTKVYWDSVISGTRSNHYNDDEEKDAQAPVEDVS
jgi:hypothetical protein